MRLNQRFTVLLCNRRGQEASLQPLPTSPLTYIEVAYRLGTQLAGPPIRPIPRAGTDWIDQFRIPQGRVRRSLTAFVFLSPSQLRADIKTWTQRLDSSCGTCCVSRAFCCLFELRLRCSPWPIDRPARSEPLRVRCLW